MKIAMITSESNPFAKTGGLADVVYALSRELVKMKEEVYIVLPYYRLIKIKHPNLKVEFVRKISLRLGWRYQDADVYKLNHEGITFYFIDNEFYFGRESLYSYGDDDERFAFFTRASVELFKQLNIKLDLIHLHDWQVGMLPLLIKHNGEYVDFYKNTKTVLTIHNPAFQGVLDVFRAQEFYHLTYELLDNYHFKFYDSVSSLKAGIYAADKLTTVSPTHALELQTKEGAKGLEHVILSRKDDFSGILNGIDYEEFDPSKDPLIAKNYSKTDFKQNKVENHDALLKRFNLLISNAPIFAIVTRLTWQKGVDLIIAGARKALRKGGYFIALGSGEYEVEQMLNNLINEFPGQVGIYIGYSNELAHLIYAGADFFFMPSLFEPCGIGQMIACRYGTLPIVRYTGGLKDTIIGYDGSNVKKANGFGFFDYDVSEIEKQTDLALDTYENKPLLQKLQLNAMESDFTWSRSAQSYLKLYKSIV